MLLKKEVKGGILLYALLMSAIFVFLLQFYLERVVAMHRQQQAQISASTAYLMAEVTQSLATEQSGQFRFNQGSASYIQKNSQLEVTVTLSQGGIYTYQFVKTEEKLLENIIGDAENHAGQ